MLSGVIGSLLATGLPPLIAAAAGAHLHGRAGERAERSGLFGAQVLWDHLRSLQLTAPAAAGRLSFYIINIPAGD